jgi:hypothetical protein
MGRAGMSGLESIMLERRSEGLWRERQFGLERGVLLKRCGGRGFRVFAGRIPAASDLVGIYEDVGTVLMP